MRGETARWGGEAKEEEEGGGMQLDLTPADHGLRRKEVGEARGNA